MLEWKCRDLLDRCAIWDPVPELGDPAATAPRHGELGLVLSDRPSELHTITITPLSVTFERISRRG